MFCSHMCLVSVPVIGQGCRLLHFLIYQLWVVDCQRFGRRSKKCFSLYPCNWGHRRHHLIWQVDDPRSIADSVPHPSHPASLGHLRWRGSRRIQHPWPVSACWIPNLHSEAWASAGEWGQRPISRCRIFQVGAETHSKTPAKNCRFGVPGPSPIITSNGKSI